MTVYLQQVGVRVNHKRVLRLIRKLGVEAIYRKLTLSNPDKAQFVVPYLLEGLAITYSNQVSASDITYIRLKGDSFICWQ